MELKGVVALYEDCLLTAVGDRAKGAYFVAPRANRGAKIGKGVVVLNSKLVVEDGVDAYLFRSPWDGKGSCYNQSTFVGCTIAEGSSLNSALVKNNSEGVGDNSVVGWKVDSTLAAAYKSKASNVGTLSDADKTAEYSNRGMILNRLIAIDGTTTSYVTDETGFWDVTGLIPAAETAKPTENPAIAAFDATSATVIWDFSGLTFAGAKFDSGDDASTGTTGFQSKSGTMPGVVSKDTSGENVVLMDINAASGKLAANTTNDGTAKGQSQFNANTILTVPVTNGAKVTLTTTSGAKSTWINNVQGDSGDVVYTATADGEAIIYATGTAYISKVVVENLNLTTLTEGQKNATKTGETKAVVISGDTTVKTGKSITLTAKAYGSYGAAATTFTWASSNTTIATVANGTVKGVAVGSTDITASVGSITSNKISVTVVYKEVSDLTADELETYNSKKSEWDNLSDEAKAEYVDFDEYALYSHSDFYLFPESYRYYKDKTFNLTVSELKEKFPSNMFNYYTTYVKYPVLERDEETYETSDISGNVKWDGKTKVTSLKVLFDPEMESYIYNFNKENNELRYYFLDSLENVYEYDCVQLFWKGANLYELFYSGTYGMYDFFSDKERTNEINLWDLETGENGLSKIYAAWKKYDKYKVTVNGEYPLLELSMEEIKTQYPESAGWKYYWGDMGAERFPGYETWAGQEYMWIFDHEPSDEE